MKLPFLALLPLLACLFLTPCTCSAQGLEITALNRNGEITWTCPEPNQTYRIEWAPTVEGPWQHSWNDLGRVEPGTAPEVTQAVPMFYRVITPAVTPSISNVSAAEAGQLILDHQTDSEFVILDVRTTSEYGQGNVVNAVNIDFYSPTFDAVLELLPRDKTYLVYCRSGGRSGSVVSRMTALDFETVYDLSGGFTAFAAEPANASLIE